MNLTLKELKHPIPLYNDITNVFREIWAYENEEYITIYKNNTNRLMNFIMAYHKARNTYLFKDIEYSADQFRRVLKLMVFV